MGVCGSAGTLILGEHTYKDLAEMHAAGVTVDMVDVFQRADRVRVLERVEREHTHTQRERERERDVRKCTHAHSLTRAASLYRMHLPLTHACTHTHTHTHTHTGGTNRRRCHQDRRQGPVAAARRA